MINFLNLSYFQLGVYKKTRRELPVLFSNSINSFALTLYQFIVGGPKFHHLRGNRIDCTLADVRHPVSHALQLCAAHIR